VGRRTVLDFDFLSFLPELLVQLLQALGLGNKWVMTCFLLVEELHVCLCNDLTFCSNCLFAVCSA